MEIDKELIYLLNFSRKSYNFNNGKRMVESAMPKVTSVLAGRVNCESGYLAVCESCCLEPLSRLVAHMAQGSFSFNNNNWQIPRIMQGDNWIRFYNKCGDGIFPVLSLGQDFFVGTGEDNTAGPIDDYALRKIIIPKIKKRNLSWRVGKQAFTLEGFVSIGSGAAIITDPLQCNIQVIEDKPDPDIATILSVEKGAYSFEYTRNKDMLYIRKVN